MAWLEDQINHRANFDATLVGFRFRQWAQIHLFDLEESVGMLDDELLIHHEFVYNEEDGSVWSVEERSDVIPPRLTYLALGD